MAYLMENNEMQLGIHGMRRQNGTLLRQDLDC